MHALRITVADRPDLSHTGGSVRFHHFGVSIHRLDASGLISRSGAHLLLFIPSALLFRCLERQKSVFDFEGPYLGHLDERHGLEAHEYGGFGQHAVSRSHVTAEANTETGRLLLRVSGALSCTRQDNDDWPVPAPLSAFEIDAQFAFENLGSVFYGKEAEMQARVDRALSRLASMKSPGDGI